MPDLTLYFITAACWLAIALRYWHVARAAHPAEPGTAAAFPIESFLVPVALVAHGYLLYTAVSAPEGMNLGVGNAISLLVWLTVAIYWLAGLAYPGLAGILGMMAPVALLAILCQGLLPAVHLVRYGGNSLFAMHFAIAMLAYALFIVATVHAIVMLAEEKWLHRGMLPPLLKSLPPLLEMEALLFRILIAAFVLLTFTLVSGVFFSEQLFGKPFRAQGHKMIFAFVSWLIFAGLLAGRYLRGWRGRVAVRWTLAGFSALLLAYIGSKVVLELVLGRV